MSRRRFAILSRLLPDRLGFTLIEMIVAAFLLSVVVGMMTPATFQILALQRNWRDDMIATKELRNGNAWFARNALNAMTTTLTDFGAATSTVTLYWRNVLGGRPSRPSTASAIKSRTN